MMLLDLVSPWAAGVHANEAQSLTSFRELHAPLLDLLHHSQTPDHHFLQLTSNLVALQQLKRLIALPTFQQPLLDTVVRAVEFGANPPVTIVLLPLDQVDEIAPLITRRDCYAILALRTGDTDVLQLQVQLARSLASLTRWHSSDSASALRSSDGRWDRWELARTVPLREWIYSAGVAWHLAQTLFPGVPTHQLFGLGAGAWQRIREQEHQARELLNHDLDQRGIGLIMKWLHPSGGVMRRRDDENHLDPKMGQYLAWRMTAPRVARVGIAEAMRGES